MNVKIDVSPNPGIGHSIFLDGMENRNAVKSYRLECAAGERFPKLTIEYAPTVDFHFEGDVDVDRIVKIEGKTYRLVEVTE